MNVKGNAAVNVGYSCKQRELAKGWRSIWSETAGTTSPTAPFGIVTLASSGTEGASHEAMGAMRLAQTAGYGVLPNDAIPHSFFAQAGDLDDAWGPGAGPCFVKWACCDGKTYAASRSSATCSAGTKGKPGMCDMACATAAGTATKGGIHPRSKSPVGERLATSAFNQFYGGKGANTGPTLSGCAIDTSTTTTSTTTTAKLTQLTASTSKSVAIQSLTIEFNTTLLAGETVQLNPYNTSLNNQVAPKPALLPALQPCYDMVAKVCADHLHNNTDCRNCKSDPVTGAAAWAKLKPVCGGRYV